MKYLKIEADAVFSALAALGVVAAEEEVRAEIGIGIKEIAESRRISYENFKAAVMAAETIEEEENEAV